VGPDGRQSTRKFYRLTPEGKKQLLREESRWTELVNAIARVMKPATGTEE
jgi:DNA-binding PadR family transcriptional regulator